MEYTINCEKCGEKFETHELDNHAFCIEDVEVFYCNDCIKEMHKSGSLSGVKFCTMNEMEICTICGVCSPYGYDDGLYP